MDITKHIKSPMGTFTFNVENMVIGGTEVLAVSARELHKELEVGRDFSTWVKDRIDRSGFVLDQDFTLVFPRFGENSKGGRPAKEYYLTVDMAKHLCMMENNERGYKARQYFINIEKEFINNSPLPRASITDMVGASLLLANSIADRLRVSNTSYLTMTKAICVSHNIPSQFIPEYVEQNPVNSLTDLLKERGIKSSARVLNPKLKELGILEQVQRKSTSSPTGTKQFWCLSEKGLYFGKNEASVHSPRETQPLYYRDKFSELLTLLGL